MKGLVNLYSEKTGQIRNFLELFYEKKIDLENELFWENSFSDPVDMIEIISCFIDNKDKFDINLWISIDNRRFYKHHR